VTPINVRPVQVIGSCPAGLTSEDGFRLEGLRLENPSGSRLCFLAIGQIPLGQGIWQLQNDERFFSHVSCPSCTTRPDQERRVVFLLGHEDKWALCEHISEYLRLVRGRTEPDAARQAREEAILCQKRGEYVQATHQMALALGLLKFSS
jgi:hypothetical protein